MTSAIPTTMTAIEMAGPGGPDVLAPATVATPQPGPGQVLIRVSAAGVNRPDIVQRQGRYPPPPGASPRLGLEVAGTIVALGENVTSWRIGDIVCALTPGGGYAEYCVTFASHCLRIPSGWSLTDAASLPETYFTVWSNVFDRAALQTGETFLVHGGASGIGVAAIQIARALDHRVFATAGTKQKCITCESLGAERAINYTTEDFVEVIKALTHDRGVDVILDMVAGDYVAKNLKVLAPKGRLVFIAFLNGAHASVNVADIMTKQLVLTGSTLRPASVEFKAKIADALLTKVWPLLDDGQIKPVVFRTFPLAEAAKAHVLMETGLHVGKLVLTVDEHSTR